MSEIQTYPKPLHVGKTGDYTYTVRSRWLSGAGIQSVTAIAPEDGITISNVSFAGNIIKAFVTGVKAGVYYVEWGFETTDGRSGGEKVAVVVRTL